MKSRKENCSPRKFLFFFFFPSETSSAEKSIFTERVCQLMSPSIEWEEEC